MNPVERVPTCGTTGQTFQPDPRYHSEVDDAANPKKQPLVPRELIARFDVNNRKGDQKASKLSEQPTNPSDAPSLSTVSNPRRKGNVDKRVDFLSRRNGNKVRSRSSRKRRADRLKQENKVLRRNKALGFSSASRTKRKQRMTGVPPLSGGLCNGS